MFWLCLLGTVYVRWFVLEYLVYWFGGVYVVQNNLCVFSLLVCVYGVLQCIVWCCVDVPGVVVAVVEDCLFHVSCIYGLECDVLQSMARK